MGSLQSWFQRTMVIERLTGVIIYALLLAFSYYILSKARTGRRVKFILNFYLFFMCVLAYFYYPGKNTDIRILREMSRPWLQLDFDEFFEQILLNDATPISSLLLYLCGKTGVDGLLPALSAFIFYSNLFYILKDLYLKHGVSADSIALSLLFIMGSDVFLEVVSGVRCFSAISILVRCIYDETFNHKSPLKNVIWCLIASLMHSFALIMYGIRVCLLIFQKKKWFLNVCVISVVSAIAYAWGGDYVDRALNKGIAYITGDAYSFMWGYLLSSFGLIIILISLPNLTGIALNIARGSENAAKQLRVLIVFLITLALILSFEYSIFHRTLVFVSMLLVPIIAVKADMEYSENYRVFVKLASILLLVVSCARGNMSGYKFFLL